MNEYIGLIINTFYVHRTILGVGLHHKFEKIKYEYSLNKTNRVTCKLYPNRVAGNAAYIIGTVAETEMGCYRILGLAKGQQGERKILADLTRMLTFDDSESVMNAAGTMGTLVSDLIKENQQKKTLTIQMIKNYRNIFYRK